MPLNVSIVSIPTDFVTVLSSFAAAFLGAAAAFGFNAWEHRRAERNRRRDLINNSVYTLSVTLNTLLNLKSQGLEPFRAEFDRLQTLLMDLDISDHNSLEQAAKVGHEIISAIDKEDSSLNGAFILWQEIDFLSLTAPEDLAFTFDGAPDLVRLLMTCRTEVRQVSKRIVYRNAVHERLVVNAMKDSQEKRTGIATLLFWQQMLILRSIIRDHTNVALAVIPVAVEQIEAYRKQKFKRSLLAKLTGRKETWISFSVIDRLKPLIPDRANYADIISTTG